MFKAIIIDKDKNSVVIEFDDYEKKRLLENKIVFDNIKRHKTKKELDSEVSEFLKEVNK